jgi:Calcineurin-like phosphoesterase
MLSTPMIALAVVVVFVVGNAFLIFGFYLPRTSAPISDPVLVGAGDIADCASSGDEATAKLLDDVSGTVYTLGDNAYESGAPSEFSECYDPTWGRFKERTRPSLGNHDYLTHEASGYFDYFGSAAGDPKKGYYSYDLGGWHVVVLNSQCWQVVRCGPYSPMIDWLEQDLASSPMPCTLAYWHNPLFSSGYHGNYPGMKPAWEALYEADAEVVLNGHDHDYERFPPQSPSGAADDARGIRQFVVGTGGRELRPFRTTIAANSEVRNAHTFGVLKLTLHPNSYEWKFVPVAGKTFTDSGASDCH